MAVQTISNEREYSFLTRAAGDQIHLAFHVSCALSFVVGKADHRSGASVS